MFGRRDLWQTLEGSAVPRPRDVLRQPESGVLVRDDGRARPAEACRSGSSCSGCQQVLNKTSMPRASASRAERARGSPPSGTRARRRRGRRRAEPRAATTLPPARCDYGEARTQPLHRQRLGRIEAVGNGAERAREHETAATPAIERSASRRFRRRSITLVLHRLRTGPRLRRSSAGRARRSCRGPCCPCRSSAASGDTDSRPSTADPRRTSCRCRRAAECAR